MTLNKISRNKYRINNFSNLVEHKGKFFIQLNSCIIPSWCTGFSCIEAAEQFISTHTITAEPSYPYAVDDFEFIIDAYDFQNKGEVWQKRKDEILVTLKPSDDSLEMTIQDGNYTSTSKYTDPSEIIRELDELFDDEVFSCICLCTHAEGQAVMAAASTREIAKNLVRVKSSNLWAYTINIKNSGDKTGDVLIQFKGKNGGPDDIYIYYDVPISLWRRFITAPSKGHFFHVYIRNNYRYSKLTGDKRTHLRNGIN